MALQMTAALPRKKQTLARRRWRNFKKNRRGFYSLLLFSLLFILSLFAEVFSNDTPFLIRYEGRYYFPLFRSYPETAFGGDFETNADYRDPYLLEKLNAPGNKVFFPLNPYSSNSIDLDLGEAVPAPPPFRATQTDAGQNSPITQAICPSRHQERYRPNQRSTFSSVASPAAT